MKWIVLSDLHMNFKNCTTNSARKKLIEQLEKERKKGKISFVLITGDCLHKNNGDPGQLSKFLKKIASVCGVKKDKLIICPGNHDVSRDCTKRNSEIIEYRKYEKMPDIETCMEAYGNFKEVYTLFTRSQYTPFFIKVVESFRIIEIDTCLLSKDDDDYGNIAVDFNELAELGNKIQKDDKINIVMMHHGVEWFKPESGRRFQHWMAEHNIKMVFCGHNHAPGLSILTEGIADNCHPRDGIPQFTCGCALSDSYSKPVFLVGEYQGKKNFQINMYEYRNNSNWELASGILRSFPKGCYTEGVNNGLNHNPSDIPKKYNTIFDTGDDISEELKNSEKLDFFGLQGSTFIKGTSKIANVLYERKENITCRMLLSDPYNVNIEQRLRNIPEYYHQSNLEQHWKEIYKNIKSLKEVFPRVPSWTLRFHELPLLFRFIMTDQHVYLGYYGREHSAVSCMYCYTNESTMYKSLNEFFNSAWENAHTSFSSIVPDRCSFVLDTFGIKPSLVINLASACNMHCCYCPDGGENLQKCSQLCDITQIKYLLTAYADYYRKKRWTEKKVIRITGGEPLLYSDRLFEVLKQARFEGYEKIVLCTNGVLLQECYEKNPKIWESIKNILLLKISLDSLKPDTFRKLTGFDDLEIVTKNIQFARSKGFKIELNFVATKENVQEIEDVYNYAHRIGLVGLKVLTINDFGGRIAVENVEEELNALIKKMRELHYIETGLYVHNNKGIHMKRFIHDGCTLTIVDHMNRENSVTPRRTYSSACKYCDYYPDSNEVAWGKIKPCATGIMSLTLRADGMLSFCRMKESPDTFLKEKTLDEVRKMVETELKKFEKCFHYEIGEEK